MVGDLSKYLVSAGPHPMWGDGGWQIAFDFGETQVSIAYWVGAAGVELMVTGKLSLWVLPATRAEVFDALFLAMEGCEG